MTPTQRKKNRDRYIAKRRNASTRRCTHCGRTGHNRATCADTPPRGQILHTRKVPR